MRLVGEVIEISIVKRYASITRLERFIVDGSVQLNTNGWNIPCGQRVNKVAGAKRRFNRNCISKINPRNNVLTNLRAREVLPQDKSPVLNVLLFYHNLPWQLPIDFVQSLCNLLLKARKVVLFFKVVVVNFEVLGILEHLPKIDLTFRLMIAVLNT